MKDSKFTGGVFGYLIVNVVLLLSIIFTAGITMPWALCFRERWTAKHTIIDGKQLEFYGSGTVLFLHTILIALIGPILIGIAIGLFFALFGGDNEQTVLGVTLWSTISLILYTLFTLWLALRMKKWIVKHTRFATN